MILLVYIMFCHKLVIKSKPWQHFIGFSFCDISVFLSISQKFTDQMFRCKQNHFKVFFFPQIFLTNAKLS